MSYKKLAGQHYQFWKMHIISYQIRKGIIRKHNHIIIVISSSQLSFFRISVPNHQKVKPFSYPNSSSKSSEIRSISYQISSSKSSEARCRQLIFTFSLVQTDNFSNRHPGWLNCFRFTVYRKLFQTVVENVYSRVIGSMSSSGHTRV